MTKEFELPNGWIVLTLNDVCEITSSKRIFKEEYVQQGVPFYRTKEIKELSEGKKPSIDLYISKSKYDDIKSKFQVPRIGDILLSAVGTIGVSYIIKDDKPFYFKDGNLMWFRDLKNIHPNFLSFALTHFIRNISGASVSGSAYNALTIETMKAFEIPFPPQAEQQRIVAKIEELFSQLDKGVESLKTAQQQLKVYKQAVLKYAFEGKLTNPDVKEGELPEGWEKKFIRELCIVVRGGSPRPAGDKRFYDGNIPFLKVKDLTRDDKKFVNYAEHSIKEAGLQKTRLVGIGTLLLSNSGATLGVPKITAIETTMNDGVAAFLDLKCEVEYLYYYWKSKTLALRAIDQGAAQPNLNTELIREQTLNIPTDRENQLKVVQEIESRLSVCDNIEESIEQGLQQAEALRQSILKKAFDGKLVQQDPNDEPASVLLERIKAERSAAQPVNKTKTKKVKA